MADPANINSRADLHAALRRLFEEFGGSYLEAATAADSGVATVHDMVRGKRLPRWASLRKVLCAFGIAEADLGAWKQAHARAERDDRDDAEPYRGLEAFEPEHVKYFFGREDLTRLLRDRVSAQIGRDGPLLVTGPSGAGKSSLLRAGLIPAADKSWPEGHVILTPSGDSVQARRGDPVHVLAERFCGDAAPDDIRNRLADEPALLHDLLTRAECRLLIVDQFEELFTTRTSADDRRVFIQALHAACTPARGVPAAVVVVIGMRADFFGYCAAHPELAPALARPLVVGPMTAAQLREAIEGPAKRAELTLEPGLAERVLEDLGAASTDDTILPAISSDPGGVLPLLSHTLLATWELREGRKLTLAGYQATGGVSKSLAGTADTALEEAGLAHRDRARLLLTRLVHLGEGSEPSRRKVPLAELLGPEDSPGHAAARQVLDRFIEHRLVTVDGTRAASTAEFTHEALIRAWKQLRDWIEEHRDSLLVREQLDRDARAWAGKGRDAAYLYRGLRLASAQGASGDDGDRLGNDARDFLDASIRQDLAEREAARRRGRNRTVLSAVLAVLLVIVTGTAMTAITLMRVSAERAAEGQSRALASLTEEMAKNDSGLAALAAIAAYNTAPTQEARSALLRRYDQFKDAAWVLSGVPGPVQDVAMSSDGSVTLATSILGRATLFVRQAGGKVLRHHLNLLGTAFSPLVSRDGRRIAYVLTDLSGSLSMFWHEVRPTAHDIILGSAHRLHGGELTQITIGAQLGDFSMAAFSPNADRIAAVTSDGLRVWDLTTQQLQTLPRRVPRLQQVWFGPDENTLVAERRDTDTDSSMVSLDIRTGKTRELEDRRVPGRHLKAGVSADGGVLVVCRTGAQKATYRAVRVADGRELKRYTPPRDYSSCEQLAIDQTGEHVAFYVGGVDSPWALLDTRPGKETKWFVGPNGNFFLRDLGPLLGTPSAPVLVHWSETGVTGWRVFPDGEDVAFGMPELLDHGRTMVVRFGERGDRLEVSETEGERRKLTKVRTNVTTPPDESQPLRVNPSETLLADVADHNRITVRDLPGLRIVAELTTRMPPAGKDGKRELVKFFFISDEELVTVSGTVIERWHARDGRRLSNPLDIRDLRIDGVDPAHFTPLPHFEPGYVQIVNLADHTLRAVNLQTATENPDLRVQLGPDMLAGRVSRSGRFALVSTRGSMIELWSVQDRRRPEKVLGPLGPVTLNKSLIGGWGDPQFFLANGNSVRFMSMADTGRIDIESYDFAGKQAFLASTPDGKALLRSPPDGGRIDLFRLDPALWQRHLCDVLGRDLSEDERRGLPPELPNVICPPR